jgi:hypothetical protein
MKSTFFIVVAFVVLSPSFVGFGLFFFELGRTQWPACRSSFSSSSCGMSSTEVVAVLVVVNVVVFFLLV